MEKQSLILAEQLLQRGFNLDLVVINTLHSAYAPNPNINLVDLKAAKIRFALPALIKYLRTTKPQVVLSAETPVNSLAILARMITGIPEHLIVSERNHLTSVAKNATRMADRFRHSLVKYLYPHSDLILTVSKGVEKDLISSSKINKKKIRSIYNMFDVNRIIAQSQARLEPLWHGKGKLPIIINVGRLSSQKDHETLIRAFAILRSKKACRLLILGEGSERPKLISLARELKVNDDVLMPGFVSNPFAYMAQANVFALSSAWEGLPGVLIEALACGVPVVSTDCPTGPAEILENGKYGVLTPVGNPFELAEAILKTLDHPLASNVLQKRAMDFSIENIMPQYLEILQPALLPSLNQP